MHQKSVKTELMADLHPLCIFQYKQNQASHCRHMPAGLTARAKRAVAGT